MQSAITLNDLYETLRQLRFGWPAVLPPLFLLGSVTDAARERKRRTPAKPTKKITIRDGVYLLLAAIIAAVAILCIATVVRLGISHELVISVVVTVSLVIIAAGLVTATVETGRLLFSYGKFRLQVFGIGLALCVVGVAALFLADWIIKPPRGLLVQPPATPRRFARHQRPNSTQEQTGGCCRGSAAGRLALLEASCQGASEDFVPPAAQRKAVRRIRPGGGGKTIRDVTP
jgi:hypothetical protein